MDGVCRIENIPQISDVTLFFSILEELGAKVRVLNQHAIEIDCHAIHSTRPSYDLARRIRASYYLLGALLGLLNGLASARAAAVGYRLFKNALNLTSRSGLASKKGSL